MLARQVHHHCCHFKTPNPPHHCWMHVVDGNGTENVCYAKLMGSIEISVRSKLFHTVYKICMLVPWYKKQVATMACRLLDCATCVELEMVNTFVGDPLPCSHHWDYHDPLLWEPNCFLTTVYNTQPSSEKSYNWYFAHCMISQKECQ